MADRIINLILLLMVLAIGWLAVITAVNWYTSDAHFCPRVVENREYYGCNQ